MVSKFGSQSDTRRAGISPVFPKFSFSWEDAARAAPGVNISRLTKRKAVQSETRDKATDIVPRELPARGARVAFARVSHKRSLITAFFERTYSLAITFFNLDFHFQRKFMYFNIPGENTPENKDFRDRV